MVTISQKICFESFDKVCRNSYNYCGTRKYVTLKTRGAKFSVNVSSMQKFLLAHTEVFFGCVAQVRDQILQLLL